jgi:peroxiredoxin
VPDDPASIVHRYGIGERVPDFVVTSLTDMHPMALKTMLGRPTLVVFYNPATGVGRDVIVYAKGLSEKQTGKVQVMAMALTLNADAARKQHADLRLPFPVLDGHSLCTSLGVENTPRLVLLDAAGIIRWEATGWGLHIPGEIAAELAQCEKR